MTREEIIKLARQAGNGETRDLTEWLEEFAALVERRAAAAEREACINKIQAEIDHALTNDLRLAVKFGQLKGDPAARISAIAAALDWLRDRGEKP